MIPNIDALSPLIDETAALLTTPQAAAHLNVSAKTLVYWRATGDGPIFTRLGARSIRYRAADLAAYVAGRRRSNNLT